MKNASGDFFGLNGCGLNKQKDYRLAKKIFGTLWSPDLEKVKNVHNSINFLLLRISTVEFKQFI